MSHQWHHPHQCMHESAPVCRAQHPSPIRCPINMQTQKKMCIQCCPAAHRVRECPSKAIHHTRTPSNIPTRQRRASPSAGAGADHHKLRATSTATSGRLNFFNPQPRPGFDTRCPNTAAHRRCQPIFHRLERALRPVSPMAVSVAANPARRPMARRIPCHRPATPTQRYMVRAHSPHRSRPPSPTFAVRPHRRRPSHASSRTAFPVRLPT